MSKAAELADDLKTLGTVGDRARTKEQADYMQKTVGKDLCPFCPPQTEKWENPVIKKFSRWILKKNDFPYKDHDHHFVIIFEEHTNDISEFTEADWISLGVMLKWTVREFGIKGGGFAMRFGHSDYNASTVRHLHAHIQVPAKKVVTRLNLPFHFHEQCNCPICKLKNNRVKILLANDSWRAADVCTPLPHHKKHIVIANTKVSNDITKIESESWIHLGTILQKLTKNMRGGGIVIRFGDSKYHGGFPGHVYCEVMEPDLSGPSRAIFLTDPIAAKPVCKATFCKDRSPEEESRRRQRMRDFKTS